MVTRKIWLDAERFVSCEVYERDCNFDYYECPKGRVEEVVKAMRDNGMMVVRDKNTSSTICVNRKKMWFQGEIYFLNQCSDLWDWFANSMSLEFTYYYDRVVFHTPSGKFCGAYREDINNYCEI